MVKTIIVYETKWGNGAELVAKSVAEGMREVPEVEAVPVDVKGLEPNRVTEFDAVVVGVIDGCFAPTGDTKKFIDGMGKVNTQGQPVAVFDAYMQKEFGTLKKTEKRITEKAPGLKLVTPGISIKIDDKSKNIAAEELPKCREFGRRFAAQIKTAA